MEENAHLNSENKILLKELESYWLIELKLDEEIANVDIGVNKDFLSVL